MPLLFLGGESNPLKEGGRGEKNTRRGWGNACKRRVKKNPVVSLGEGGGGKGISTGSKERGTPGVQQPGSGVRGGAVPSI